MNKNKKPKIQKRKETDNNHLPFIDVLNVKLSDISLQP